MNEEVKSIYRNLIVERAQRGEIELEIGPGENPRIPGALKIDHLPLEGVDIVADLIDALQIFPNDSVVGIYSYHVLEHIPNLGGVLTEMHRILKRGGVVAGTVPHFANPYFYSDYTHLNHFGLYTFSYFSKSPYFTRTVPSFYNDTHFEIAKVRLGFTSPFHTRYPIKKVMGFLVNSCKWMQELHEEMFCYIFPAYEIEFKLNKI